MRGYQTEAAEYREIANKIRDLALEARSTEIEEDLLDLAARLDRMAELSENPAKDLPAKARPNLILISHYASGLGAEPPSTSLSAEPAPASRAPLLVAWALLYGLFTGSSGSASTGKGAQPICRPAQLGLVRGCALVSAPRIPGRSA